MSKKIFVPQVNSNDEEYEIINWNFKNKDYVKKGQHILTIESTKVAEEIYCESEGFIEIISYKGEKVKPGALIGRILNQKADVREVSNKNEKKVVITKKANELIKKNNISIDVFFQKKLITEQDVLKVIKSSKKNKKEKQEINCMLLISFKENKPYHAGIYLNDIGIADLSLLGSRITPVEKYNTENNNFEFFKLDIDIKDKNKLHSFLKEPVVLTEKIIKKEKSTRGWFKTTESADFILKFRNKRSKNIEDVNCIEWLVLSLEKNSINLPDNILTANRLYEWSKKNLALIEKNKNLEIFKNFYK